MEQSLKGNRGFVGIGIREFGDQRFRLILSWMKLKAGLMEKHVSLLLEKILSCCLVIGS